MSPKEDRSVFADLSGILTSNCENPYDALIEACSNDPVSLATEHDIVGFMTEFKNSRGKSSTATKRTARLGISNKKPSCSLKTFQGLSLIPYLRNYLIRKPIRAM